MNGKILIGNCVELMQSMDVCSIDAIVTDPPYGIGFMGKEFDKLGDGLRQQMWHLRWVKEALRVLKPGGHILAFGGTRTYHRLVCALEDAGFQIRDTIVWMYGQGFPKNHDISKAIDKSKGIDREIIGKSNRGSGAQPNKLNNHGIGDTGIGYADGSGKEFNLTAPASPEAKQWKGWGTALKPAIEMICLARKPVEGTIANNVLKYGTGGLNIAGSLIPLKEGVDDRDLKTINRNIRERDDGWGMTKNNSEQNIEVLKEEGRYPANVILDEEAGEMLDRQTGVSKSGVSIKYHNSYEGKSVTGMLRGDSHPGNQHGDSGGASRFFYCAKASKKERNAGLDESFEKEIGHNRFDKCKTCNGYILQNQDRPSACKCKNPVREHNKIKGNFHPTVKPVALMKYLIKLITPPDGKVLDPFIGSGTTGVACEELGFEYVGLEMDSEYSRIAMARCEYASSHTEKIIKPQKQTRPKSLSQTDLFSEV